MNTAEKGWISISWCSLLLLLPSGGEFGGGLCNFMEGVFKAQRLPQK